jgi:hypothetical protein
METLATIDFLFPSYDPKSSDYLRQLQEECDLDEHILQPHAPPPRNDDEFTFYRAKLAILFNELNNPESFSIKQLWDDRRDKQRWLTLWIAVIVFILTVLFGVISTVTAIMEASFSYRSLKLQEMEMGIAKGAQ